LRAKTGLALYVLLSVMGVGLLASGLSFVSIALYEHTQTSAPASWRTSQGVICDVRSIQGSSPELFQSTVCYRVNGQTYRISDLPSPVRATLGTVREVRYDPGNVSLARDIAQQKPDWMGLLQKGGTLLFAALVTLIYSLFKVARTRRKMQRR
jgi:hypothetical protein